MEEIKIVSRWDSSNVLVCGQYESISDCVQKKCGTDLRGAYLRVADLNGADLRGADLSGAYLSGAYLRGAYLRGADLRGAKNYCDHHSFWQEIIRTQKESYFTTNEWALIGKILVHRHCWDKIIMYPKKTMLSIFKKLADVGYDEWLNEFKRIT